MEARRPRLEPQPPRERFEGAVARRRGMGGLAAALFGTAGALLWAGLCEAEQRPYAAILLILFVVGLVRRYRFVRQSGGDVEVGAEGLFVQGKLVVARGAGAHAVMLQEAGGVRVSIQGVGAERINIDASSPEEGARLLQALQMDSAAHITELVIDQPRWVFPVTVLLPFADCSGRRSMGAGRPSAVGSGDVWHGDGVLSGDWSVGEMS